MKKILLVVKKLLFIVGFCCVFLVNNTQAQSRWTSGGPYGEEIRSLSISQTNPNVMYAATHKGVFKTINSGESWNLTDQVINYVDVVQVDPTNSNIVYAGTSSEVYKTENGGVTWDPKGLPQNNIKTIVIDPLNPLTIYVGTAPDSPGLCLFKSVNGGNNWGGTIGCEDGEGIHSIIIDNDDPANIYAGLQTGPDSGINLVKSLDRGETWIFNITVGPYFINDVVALAITPTSAEEAAIYAVVEGDDIYKSIDRGENWTPTNTPFISSDAPWALAVDPNDPAVIYVGTYKNDGEIYKSENAGTSWSLMSNGLPDGGGPSGMAIDPRNNSVYVSLVQGGIYASIDGGANWHHQKFPWSVNINDLAIDPFSSDRVLAAIDGGDDLVATSDGGASWYFLVGSPRRLGAVAIDPQNSSNIWVGDDYYYGWSCSGVPPDEFCICIVNIYVYKSKNGGQSWDSYRLKTSDAGTSSSCTASINDILIKADDSDTLLVSDDKSKGYLHRTDDGGLIWEITGTVSTALAADPNNPNIVYRGTPIGGVFRSSDFGFSSSTWEDISPTIIAVRDIEVDSASRVYVAASDGLLRWDGTDWATLTGLPAADFTSLAIDRTANPETIYVGTGGDGVFVSKDEGNIWTPINEGLGNLFITKLAISSTQPKTLYAGTAYGGVWSMNLNVPIPGDINNDGNIDLTDAILAIKQMSNVSTPILIYNEADINNDGIIALEEAIYALQVSAEIRQ